MVSSNKFGSSFTDYLVGTGGTILSYERKLIFMEGFRSANTPLAAQVARGLRVGLFGISAKWEWGSNNFRRFDLQAGTRNVSVGVNVTKGAKPVVRGYAKVAMSDQRVKLYKDHISVKKTSASRAVTGNGTAIETRLQKPAKAEFAKMAGRGALQFGTEFGLYLGAGELYKALGVDASPPLQLLTAIGVRQGYRAAKIKITEGKLPDDYGRQSACSMVEGAASLAVHKAAGSVMATATDTDESKAGLGFAFAQFGIMSGVMSLHKASTGVQCELPLPEQAHEQPIEPSPVVTETRYEDETFPADTRSWRAREAFRSKPFVTGMPVKTGLTTFRK